MKEKLKAILAVPLLVVAIPFAILAVMVLFLGATVIDELVRLWRKHVR